MARAASVKRLSALVTVELRTSLRAPSKLCCVTFVPFFVAIPI